MVYAGSVALSLTVTDSWIKSRGALKKLCCAVFTNRIEDLRLQDLAEVDLREVIYQVQEFFGDFTVLDPHHFAVPIQQNQVTLQPFTWDYGRRYARRLL